MQIERRKTGNVKIRRPHACERMSSDGVKKKHLGNQGAISPMSRIINLAARTIVIKILP